MSTFHCSCGKPASKHPNSATVGWWVEHVDDADFAVGQILGRDFERMATPAECLLFGIERGAVISITVDDYLKGGQ